MRSSARLTRTRIVGTSKNASSQVVISHKRENCHLPRNTSATSSAATNTRMRRVSRSSSQNGLRRE